MTVSLGSDSDVSGSTASVSDDGQVLTITLSKGEFAQNDELTVDLATNDGNGVAQENVTFSVTFNDGTKFAGDFSAAVDGASTGLVTADVQIGQTIQGTDGDDILLGGGGDDILLGGGGDDILDGGAGQNTLTGGEGADTFVLAHLDTADLITDYNFVEGDDIDLTALFTTDIKNSDGGADDKQLSDFVRIVENGNDASLEVDHSGSGNFTHIATLQGIAAGDTVNITFNDDDGGASSGDIVV